MDIILIIIGCIVLFFILRSVGYKILFAINKKKRLTKPSDEKNISNTELSVSNVLKTADDCNKKIVQMISSDFAQIGWSKWEGFAHEEPNQLDRLRRATLYGDNIHIVQYNSLLGIAKIKGTSGNYYLTSGKRCSCPDYRNRLKPCKHMYKLAVFLTDEEMRMEKDISIKGSRSHDNVLGGLRFTIVGQGQTEIKEFIVDHSGIYGSFGWNETSAIVLASDIMTEKRAEAVARDVEILTFEQLQNLFDIYFENNKYDNV